MGSGRKRVGDRIRISANLGAACDSQMVRKVKSLIQVMGRRRGL